MKNTLRANVIILLSLIIVATSCDEDDPAAKTTPVVATEVNDLNAVSASKFKLFSFESNSVVLNSDSASTKWDIGFRGTTLILNSGVSGPGAAGGLLTDGIFDELLVAPASGYAADSESTKAIKGSGGWYTYTGESVPMHAILPNAGKILVLKTAAGNFVKVEILSYYKGNPSTTSATFADLATRQEARYYTFRYLYQPNGTTSLQATE